MMPDQQLFTGVDDVAGLGWVKTNMTNVWCQTGNAKLAYGRRRICYWKQFARGQIDTFIRGLRRQNHRHQQFKGVGIKQLGGRMRVDCREPCKYGTNRGRVKLRNGGTSQVLVAACVAIAWLRFRVHAASDGDLLPDGASVRHSTLAAKSF